MCIWVVLQSGKIWTLQSYIRKNKSLSWLKLTVDFTVIFRGVYRDVTHDVIHDIRECDVKMSRNHEVGIISEFLLSLSFSLVLYSASLCLFISAHARAHTHTKIYTNMRAHIFKICYIYGEDFSVSEIESMPFIKAHRIQASRASYSRRLLNVWYNYKRGS